MNNLEKLVKDQRVTILALSWRDIKSPTSGGAEVHTHEMLRRLPKDKYRVIHYAAKYPECASYEEIDGICYYRKGSIWGVIFKAFIFYLRNKKNIDYVLDQCNTHRFFTPFYVSRKKRVFYIHQLTREIWDINCKFPFSFIGKITENMLLRIYRKDRTIALSQSTKTDLVNVGFVDKNISIIGIGVDFEPWKKSEFLDKEKNPTFVYVGRYAKYKGIDVALEAYGKLKVEFPEIKMWILGKKDQEYIDECLSNICEKYNITWSDGDTDADVISWGFVSEEKKLELLSKSTVLLFPSIREGWGIPITEAGNVGTPSIVFDSPGIRDAIDFGKAGYLCEENSVEGIENQMRKVIVDKEEYSEMIEKAYAFSNKFVSSNLGKNLDHFFDMIKGE